MASIPGREKLAGTEIPYGVMNLDVVGDTNNYDSMRNHQNLGDWTQVNHLCKQCVPGRAWHIMLA